MKMGYAGYESIKIKGIEALKTIEELEMSILPNEHARMRVRGIAKEETGTDYINHNMYGENVQIINEADNGKIIFNGQILNVDIKKISGLFYIEVKAISGS